MATNRTLLASVSEPTLYVAFELGARTWTLGMTSGFSVAPWVKGLPASDWPALRRLLARAKVRFGLPAAAPVVSCYEAGRDGFWIHRALAQEGIGNRVVDSASIEVNRRQRRAKTDRIDARKLVQMLVRVCLGEGGVWREVRVPAEVDEAARHVSRERTQLTQDHTRVVNQIRSWLAGYGVSLPRHRSAEWWTRLQDWAGRALPAELQQRIARAEARLALLQDQLAMLRHAQDAAVAAAAGGSPLARLVRVKSIAATTAQVLLDEGLVWRQFRNRRQVGGLLGFGAMPYQSGDEAHDQGVDRAGNRRWRAVSIQLAWNWVRWQPSSALTQWYQQRFGGHGKRARRIGIVALARKLVIALWRYVTTGEQPTGMVVKAA